jgi:hypothetical protein
MCQKLVCTLPASQALLGHTGAEEEDCLCRGPAGERPRPRDTTDTSGAPGGATMPCCESAQCTMYIVQSIGGLESKALPPGIVPQVAHLQISTACHQLQTTLGRLLGLFPFLTYMFRRMSHFPVVSSPARLFPECQRAAGADPTCIPCVACSSQQCYFQKQPSSTLDT